MRAKTTSATKCLPIRQYSECDYPLGCIQETWVRKGLTWLGVLDSMLERSMRDESSRSPIAG